MQSSEYDVGAEVGCLQLTAIPLRQAVEVVPGDAPARRKGVARPQRQPALRSLFGSETVKHALWMRCGSGIYNQVILKGLGCGARKTTSYPRQQVQFAFKSLEAVSLLGDFEPEIVCAVAWLSQNPKPERDPNLQMRVRSTHNSL